MDENREKIFQTCGDPNILISLLVKYNSTDIDNFRWLAKLHQTTKDATGEDKIEKEKKLAKLKIACKDTEQVLVKVKKTLYFFFFKNYFLVLFYSYIYLIFK